jgi:hypothetical protein
MKTCLLALAASCLLYWPAHAQQSLSDFQFAGTTFLNIKIDGVKSKRLLKHSVPLAGVGTDIPWTIVSETYENKSLKNCKTIQSFDTLLKHSGISSEALREQVERAFKLWSDIAGVRFPYVDDIRQAKIIIGAQSDPEGWAFADVLFRSRPKKHVDTIVQSIICLNPLKKWTIEDEGPITSSSPYCLRHTLAHEIGHAIGLDHPPTTTKRSLMSYRYEGCRFDASKNDKVGAKILYGPSKTPPSG